MNLKTDRNFMLDVLKSILNENEIFYTPFYGCLMNNPFSLSNYFGFFARTDSDLLIAILDPFNAKKIKWYTRVPLDIKKVKIHKSLIPKQYVIKMVFNQGKPCKIRMSKKLFCGDFIDQEQNVTSFLEYFTQYI